MDELKMYVELCYKKFRISNEEYSKDGKEADIIRIYGSHDELHYHLKLIDQKIFKNYKVLFLIEKIYETKYLYLIAFIKTEDGDYLLLNYDLNEDEYTIENSKGITVSEHELKKEKLFHELKFILKKSFDYIEMYNKKKIQRIINPEETEEEIKKIKFLMK